MLNPSWMAVGEALELMCDRGSCVELSYDEESAVWGVMWVTSGKRFVAHDKSPLKAAADVLGQATNYALDRRAQTAGLEKETR